ncbi:putative baseplate hub protein [Saliniradius amylolyticus]|uniref:Putative baseplate hub protein n=1 Tax=Saliniradius amylolyticus TaxID=2183582 RepID=A0A2S2E755_9ALTE|nr:contractile injection system protein, VgrG/Pvc8 family [Saliniradius amylolyticus]AWL12797.1 putative baseplate hub protein [Saliniradius amylolyticus]
MQFDYQITADGNDITNTIRPLFKSLEVQDNAGNKPDTLVLTLVDDGRVAFPQRESELEVRTGYAGRGLHMKGRFTVEDIDLGLDQPIITIKASSAKLRWAFRSHRDHTWQNITLQDAINQMAERNGFKAAVSDFFSQFTIEHYLQQGQSDADLAKQWAEEYGATLKATTDRLIFMEKGSNTSASGKALPVVPLALNELVKGSLTLSGSVTYEGVMASWQDLDQAERQSAVAGNRDGQRIKKLPELHDNEAQAQAAADSEWHLLQRKEYQLNIKSMPAVPELTAERVIELSGHRRAQFNTTWVIDSLTETLDDRGFLQKLSAVAPKDSLEGIPRLAR